MLIIDSHLDLSWNAVGWNRDLTRTIAEIRAAEAGLDEKGRGRNTVSLPEMRRSEMVVCLATVLARANPEGKSSIDFRNQEIAYAMSQGQLAYYRILEEEGQLRRLTGRNALDAHLRQWPDAPPGYILAMEGADPIVCPGQLPQWFEAGLRVIGLAHHGPSAYAHGTGSAGGLFPQGRELLKAMEDLGVVLDATHLADASFWEALEAFRGPVLASHNNCRALVPGDRQFSDDQIRALVERDAVIGVAFDAWMLRPDWTLESQAADPVPLEAAADHIDHICQVAGNARHAAIGSDLDGGYGTEQTPAGLDTIADLQKIPNMLRRRGYTEPDIEAVMHGNWIRFFRRVLA